MPIFPQGSWIKGSNRKRDSHSEVRVQSDRSQSLLLSSVNLTVEFIVDEVVANVAQRVTTGGTAETVAVDLMAGGLGHYSSKNYKHILHTIFHRPIYSYFSPAEAVLVQNERETARSSFRLVDFPVAAVLSSNFSFSASFFSYSPSKTLNFPEVSKCLRQSSFSFSVSS